MTRKVTSLALLGCLVLVPLSARAGLLNVVNPSFETPGGLADGQVVATAIPGWTGFDPQVLNPAAGVDTATGIAPDGNNVGVAAGFNPPTGGPSDGALSQTLTSVLTLNTAYILTVDIGRTLPVSNMWEGTTPTWNGYRVTLLVGNNVLAQDNNTVAVPVGGFALSTVSYTVQPGNRFIGDPLTIKLTTGSTIFPSVALFDKVQMASHYGGILAGDVDNDGIVNGQDIALIASNWLHTGTGASYPPGDANGDGIVNGQDIAVIASHWLWTSNGPPGGGTAVPEPSTLILAALGGLAFVAFQRRRA